MRRSFIFLAAFILNSSLALTQEAEIKPVTLKSIAAEGKDIQYFQQKNTSNRQATFEEMDNSADSLDLQWTRLGAGTTKASSMTYSPDGSKLYGAKGSAIYLSEDNGESWTEIFLVPDQSYNSSYMTYLRNPDSDPNSLFYKVDYAGSEQYYGLHRLDLSTLESEAVYGGVDVSDYCILDKTGTDTIAVMVEDQLAGHEVWITVDGGKWWKNIHSGSFKERINFFHNSKGHTELVIAGTGGMLHLDFDEAWANQDFNWINDIKTIERGDSVSFTRTVGPITTIPGTQDMLVGLRWFTDDKYDDGHSKRAKFWRVSFEDKFAEEYTNIAWNDDTTGISDPTQRGFGTTDLPWCMAFDKNNPDTWWIGEGNEILRTTDAGQSWTIDTFAYRDLWIVFELLLDPNNPGHVTAVCESGTVETYDDFASFGETGITGLVLQGMGYHKDEQGNRTYYYADWYQWLYCEDDDGALLGKVRLEYDYPMIGKVLADPFVKGRFYITAGHNQGGFVHRSSDYGKSEELSFNSTAMGSVRTIAANPVQANEIWFIGDPNFKNPYPTVRKSRYGGDKGSWNAITISESGEVDYSFHNFLVFNPVNKDVVYSNGIYKVGIESVIDVLKSTNGGKNWKKYDSDNGLPRYGNGINTMDINPFDTAFIYASSYQWPFVSSDGGESWEEQTIKIAGYDSLFSFQFLDLRYTAFEDVIVGRGGNNDLVISNDNGENWISLRDGITLPNNINLRSLEVDVSNDGSKLIIYCSTDGASIVRLELTEEQLRWTIPSDPTSVTEGIIWNRESLIYPNPSNGTVFIRDVEKASIRIFTNSGAMIHEDFSYDQDYRTDILQKYPTGIYIVVVKDKTGIRSDKILLSK